MVVLALKLNLHDAVAAVSPNDLDVGLLVVVIDSLGSDAEAERSGLVVVDDRHPCLGVLSFEPVSGGIVVELNKEVLVRLPLVVIDNRHLDGLLCVLL